MPLSPSLTWEVRPTGDPANSGAFRAGASGVDHSQRDTPLVAFTDLLIDAADPAKVTSATVGFDADHDGNTINISGGTGFTPGTYEVLSVSSGVATLDRACGATGSTGGVGRLGGAKASPKPLESIAVTGNTVWTKSGTYDMGSGGLSFSQGSIRLIGYHEVRGDLDGAIGSPNRPKIRVASGWWVSLGGTGRNVVANLDVAGSTGSTGGIILTDRGNLVSNCRVTGPAAYKAMIELSQGYGTIEACEVSGDAPTAALLSGGAASAIRACHVHDITTGDGVSVTSGSTITGNVVANVAGHGIKASGGSTTPPGPITHNTIHGCGGDGIAVTALAPSTVVRGNLITAIAGDGLSNDTPVGFMPSWDGNAYQAITGGRHANLDGPSPFTSARDVTLSANPFLDAANGDYRLNATAGGGAACRGTAPGNAWPGLTIAGALDMGAVQSASGGTASGNSYFWLEG